MHKRNLVRAVLSITFSVALAGCVTPRVVHSYDPQCQIMTRKVELSVEKVQALDACSNHECVAQVLGGAVALATSTVISGSVALVGIAAFWLEKSANCRAPSPSASGGPVAPAASTASAAR